MTIDLILESKEIKARGKYDFQSKKVMVLKGSTFRKDAVPSLKNHPYYAKREAFINLGLLNSDFSLIEDYEFDNPSLASSLILGRSSSGPRDWKTLSGKSLEEHLNMDVTLIPENEKFEKLKTFLEDIDILENLKDEVGFNIFRTLNIVNNEIRHSNVIAWLLNPYETHDLKDEFTKLLLRDIYSKNKSLYKLASLENVFLWDYNEVKIYREKDHIDILMVDEKNYFIFAIENKLRSKEHDNQLSRYKKLLYEKYPKSKYKHIFTYLTINQEEASDEEWASYSYHEMIKIIERISKQTQSSVKLFLEDYIEMIRRDIVTDDKIIQLCQDIYNKHKTALDLIFQYKPDLTSDIADFIKDIVSEFSDYSLNHSIKNYIRFSSPKLEPINQKYKSVDAGWVKDHSVLLHEIRIHKNRIILTTVVGPTTDDSRVRIMDFYQGKVNEELKSSPKWTTLKSTDIIRYNETDDLSEILNKLENKLKNVLPKHVNEIDGIFSNYI